MNKLTIIGNLTKDPELRTTSAGVNVCTFTLAVNKRKRRNDEQADADFFRVTAWRELGDICAKWLQKGKKACVVGPVGVSTFTGSDGGVRAVLEVTADDVEFLSPKVSDLPPEVPASYVDEKTGYQQVNTDDLPF